MIKMRTNYLASLINRETPLIKKKMTSFMFSKDSVPILKSHTITPLKQMALKISLAVLGG